MALRRRAGQDRPGARPRPPRRPPRGRRARPGRPAIGGSTRGGSTLRGRWALWWCWPAPTSSVGARSTLSPGSSGPRRMARAQPSGAPSVASRSCVALRNTTAAGSSTDGTACGPAALATTRTSSTSARSPWPPCSSTRWRSGWGGRARPRGSCVTSRPGSTGRATRVLLQARELWATTRDVRARRLLGPACDGSLPFVTALAAVESSVLDAEIALAQGAHPFVRRRLHDALRRAATQGVVRPLLRAAPAVHQYLEQRRGSFDDLDRMVGRVLSAAPVGGRRRRSSRSPNGNGRSSSSCRACGPWWRSPRTSRSPPTR